MMSVIVDHRDPVFFTFELETTVRVFEFRKSLLDLLERNLKFKRNCRRGESVVNVVLSGNRQGYIAEYVVSAPNGEGRAE